ncbi:MAG TPA: polysaccharide deacetylase family protein [Ktedonosporobacter sp.]|nr:polysaccharide deacetylase family protein [Ktedonosporobacter sp.]
MNLSSAHAFGRLIPRFPIIASMRGVTFTVFPHTPAEHLIPRSASRVIALTFDDGPNPVFTPQVLRMLRQYRVRATFFCIGGQVQRYPYLLRQMYQAGEVIGNHTWSHPNLTKLPSDAIRQELRSTSLVIQQTIGVPPEIFRPPYGATNARVRGIAAQLGLRQILWTIDTHDWRQPGVKAIVNAVLTNARNGSIVVMHDGGGNRSQTVQALPQIIVGLQQRGFTYVTV